MEPILSEQQSLMRETAVRLCKDHGGPKRARALRDSGTEMDIPAWAWVCSMSASPLRKPANNC